MTLTIIFTLVLIGTCFAVKNWRRTAGTAYGITLILFFAFGSGPVPAWLLASQADYASAIPNNWRKQNTIVLLGAGIEAIPQSNQFEAQAFAYGRIAKAAALYNACKKKSSDCKILVSGGDARNVGNSEAGTVLLYLQNPRNPFGSV